ncbi:anhydro-N-acetylmuramic acid kinase [Rhizobium rosettiformans W3]|nr:anhydro-N-acetylmuramic acid kinase [Rhizobium rosettiformans W3]
MADIKTAIGLMSGTSMDGIDVALVRTDGEAIVERGAFLSVPYEPAFRDRLKQALEDARAIRHRDERPGALSRMERDLTLRHADAVRLFLERQNQKPGDIDLIGFHGQTVLHRPDEALTVQLGDGTLLAAETGIDVVYDMRANDMVHGGQGAPLVPVYHQALAHQISAEDWPVCFVNIGGISNLTFLDRDGTIIGFDSGPGNTLIDQWVEAHAGIPYDDGGRIASEGSVVMALAERYLANSFFTAETRRSLDRNDFRPPEGHEAELSDGARTLAFVSAAAILKSAGHLPSLPKTYVICGGGRLNRTIMADLVRLAGEKGATVLTAEQAGFDGDAMEAEAWAYLAVRSARGLALTFPGTTEVLEPVSGGVLAPSVILRTPRLVLTRWSDGDEERLVELHGTPETSAYVGHGKPWDRHYARERLAGWRTGFHRHGCSTLKLITASGSQFVGRAGISWYEDAQVHQLAYSIVQSNWGKGYASEIASALVGWFFEAEIGQRLEAMAHVDNAASLHILKKIGFREIDTRSVRGEPCRFFEMTRAGYADFAKERPSRNPTS